MRWNPAVFFAALSFCTSVFAATPEQIQNSIDRAKAYLYSQQHQGLWEKQPKKPDAEAMKRNRYSVTGGQWGGETALATYALLAAGESPQEPRLQAAIKFLRETEIEGVYALGMKAQIYNYLPPTPETRHEVVAMVKQFRDGINKEGAAIGLYDYLLGSERTNRVDHSVSQYAVLGVWACQRAGSEVPSDYWKKVEEAWLRDQEPRGGWAYAREATAEHPYSESMTAAGVATLFITQDYLHADNGVTCKGNIPSPAIDKGLQWLGENFSKIFTKDQGHHGPYYTMYGIERIGVASGLKYFGAVNWFGDGANSLLASQKNSGAWPGGIQDTCFCLLFLARGRAPVVFNKLQYELGGKAGNWNQRPRDIANLTRWISKETERDLNWQIINLKAAPADLHDAPVLYISGNEPLHFTADEQARLRQFCQEGGLILGHPDCGNVAFSNTFQKLGMTLFPAYAFRQLPAGHPIFTDEQYPRSKWKTSPVVWSLSNGVREMMVLLPPSDPARWWQLQEYSGHEADFQLADDVFLYAAGKENLLEKGKTYLVNPDKTIVTDRAISMARLEYTGNWDPEPAGWRRLSAILHNSSKINLEISTVKLGTAKLGDGHGKGPSIAHLTGTAKFSLDAASRAELKNFVTGGGTLIVDAAGGSSDFAASAESELDTIFGIEALKQLNEPLPATAAIYNLANSKIVHFGYRQFARSTLGTLQGPRVKAIVLNHRPAVFYSREDLSAGLVGESVDGILGYDPATATAIMENLILSAGH